jgi:hypothetical protein
MSDQEMMEILRLEYAYWRDASPADPTARETNEAIRIGAMGAIANVMAALSGSPAPWHKEK